MDIAQLIHEESRETQAGVDVLVPEISSRKLSSSSLVYLSHLCVATLAGILRVDEGGVQPLHLAPYSAVLGLHCIPRMHQASNMT